MTMSKMLAFTLHGTSGANNRPTLAIGARQVTWLYPEHGQDDSFWICIIDAKNPKHKVKDWVVPAQNATVPADIDTYLNNPDYIYAVATQYLKTEHVPQGAFYDFLVKYGADRELQQLKQVEAVIGHANITHVSYVLTGHCGPREHDKPIPASYELGSYTGPAILMMSLMPQKSGAPPYGLCDSYTWTAPAA